MKTSQQVHRGIARILKQTTVAEGFLEITVCLDDPVPELIPRPGQFFTLLPPGYPRPLIRRPFAYSGINIGDTGKLQDFSFIYEIRGVATRDLAGAPPDTGLDWIGPSGSIFPAPIRDSRPVIVAGGIGIGPLYFLATRLASSGFQPLMVLGARTSRLVPRLSWPENAELRICTDDGSEGIRGTVLNGIEQQDIVNGDFYTCGPRQMMEAVHHLAVGSERPCHVSMEEIMACGVGACQGCAVPVIGPEGQSYARACVEGPVFNSLEIVW